MEKTAPIIIKRIKKGGHGHHGGAWKVAYADFVTAMMAFFLLLWLISVSTQEQRSGLADYFTPTVGIKDDVGIGTKGGLTVTMEGERRENKSDPSIMIGGMPAGSVQGTPEKRSINEVNADASLFENAMEKIRKNIESDPDLVTFKDNVDAKITPDGLKIEITDSDKYPMFEPNTGKLTTFGETVMKKMGEMIRALPNHITITGHTDAGKIEKAEGISNWELSTDRANAARRFFAPLLEKERITKVIGAADRELLLPSSPTSPKNRRITVLLIRGSYLDGQGQGENLREMLTVPKPVDTSKLDVVKKPAEPAPEEKKPAPTPEPALPEEKGPELREMLSVPKPVDTSKLGIPKKPVEPMPAVKKPAPEPVPAPVSAPEPSLAPVPAPVEASRVPAPVPATPPQEPVSSSPAVSTKPQAPAAPVPAGISSLPGMMTGGARDDE